ncbi:ABC-2 type transport system permease protein [Natranaerovirga hydrolytica]|uniref:ABC-2 type transport system permease protein n=1 Tax=Natranaerovirga hydrolytica TaxID=680378 RepID=A0A4R1MMK0_9FIRM|nr:ABC transporter permease [Natranaerovirga hydrolytica]TCK93340.1 ABC-2 type transport system permease protein [Natranaerovirga hydrolytica]
MTLFKFVFKRFFKYKFNFLLLFGVPFLVLFPVNIEHTFFPIGFQFYSMIIMIVSVRLAAIIAEDRMSKVLIRIGVAPLTHFKYLFQNLLAYSILLIGQNALVILVGVILYNQEITNPLGVFIIYSVFAITSIGFALAWYAFFRNKETAFQIAIAAIVAISMLGGLFWPVEIMPDLLQKIARLVPSYWVYESMRLLNNGANLIEFVMPLLVLLLFAIIFILLGSRRKMV